ncbi:cardiolipin synthase [Clostridia bacterium]|nr:cardiolipin synthase [Clostridia bacterium]
MYFLSFQTIANIIFAIVIVSFGRKSPASMWAWLLVALLVPYVGFALYILIGLDGRRYRNFAEKARKDEASTAELWGLNYETLDFVRNQREFVAKKNVLTVPQVPRLGDLAHLNFAGGSGALSDNNAVGLYYEGEDMFSDLIKDIENAQTFVHLLYYIFHSDATGKRVIAALTEKAKQGADVRLLLDGMGCWDTNLSVFKEFKKAGGKLCRFLPPYFMRVNFRNHRKIAVIDGKIGYLGGLNIGDEYKGASKRFGHWRDTHMRIAGGAVKALELRFILDWNFSAKNHPIDFKPQYFPISVQPAEKGVNMQIVSSGPDTKWGYIHYSFNKMIHEAERNIYIQTPYFSPDDSILEALKIAALAGADVRVIIPGKPDHPFVYWASLSYLGDLLAAGGRAYRYEKGFLHGKTITIDGVASSVGTANMDVRSFKLNFEVNAFIYDQPLTEQLDRRFMLDLSDCTEITYESYLRRGVFTRMREAVSRLLSPLL